MAHLDAWEEWKYRSVEFTVPMEGKEGEMVVNSSGKARGLDHMRNRNKQITEEEKK